MGPLPQKLLSTPLRVKWDHGHAGAARAAVVIADTAPGVRPEPYAEASRRAGEMDGSAFGLADAWFVSQGKGLWPSAAELETRRPGFAWDDYGEAVNKNILWARK